MIVDSRLASCPVCTAASLRENAAFSARMVNRINRLFTTTGDDWNLEIKAAGPLVEKTGLT
jgi:hypothetical protein